MNTSFYTIGQAAKLLGVSVVTIRRWANMGTLPFTRTVGGHRRFQHEHLVPSSNDGKTVLYARVSSRDQAEDLHRQVNTLHEYAAQQQWHDPWVIKDIGSGLNTRKPGLRSLIAAVLNRTVRRLVLTHKDRLLRFANDLILDICRSMGVEVVVVHADKQPDPQTVWCESIVEIMTVFCSSLYGRRAHKNAKSKPVPLSLSTCTA